ncbi:hypothetical protein [Gemmobacter lutimaris]|nr:hypothetical protein [Gemmobacter lutimaris]
MAKTPSQPQPQQGGASVPAQQQGQSSGSAPQQQGGTPIIRDWASI